MASVTHAYTQRYLAPGARIAVIAPSSPFAAEDFAHGLERLRTRYVVQHDPDIFEQNGYLAGDDERRLRELEAALDDPQVAAIMAARGGYGATRILPHLDVARVRRHAPMLIGFSDVTALHALWAHARVGSVHGSMVAALGRCSDAQFERFASAIEGHFPESISGLTTIHGGVAEGVLLGGNLAVLHALLGTAQFPPLAGAVLFLEDIGERPYRVDRMLTSLRNSGALAAVRGIALGAFVQGEPGPDGTRLEHVLAERLGDLGIPVVAGLPCGHIDDNHELPFGHSVRLDATRGQLHLSGRQS